jgi:hypothetical protein
MFWISDIYFLYICVLIIFVDFHWAAWSICSRLRFTALHLINPFFFLINLSFGSIFPYSGLEHDFECSLALMLMLVNLLLTVKENLNIDLQMYSRKKFCCLLLFVIFVVNCISSYSTWMGYKGFITQSDLTVTRVRQMI